ncbi:MAG: FRG domain-containing protein [Chitinophagaceae bacterium]|nr:MAG: FRG domain-containing protein [Chitinophagaceae bacterium]
MPSSPPPASGPPRMRPFTYAGSTPRSIMPITCRCRKWCSRSAPSGSGSTSRACWRRYPGRRGLAQDFVCWRAMEAPYTTIPLKHWNDFRSFVDQLSENWVFRGQAAACWNLQNTVERTDFIRIRPQVEAEFMAEFQRGARNYLTRDQIPEHLIEWLALMQHHGAPTRLLDFTKSPFIAAYFAFEIALPEGGGNVAIWAINIHYLKQRSLEALRAYYGRELEESHDIVNESLFEKIFYDNRCSLVFPVEPFRMNRRYSLQQSIFVSTGRAAEPFMDQLQFLGPEMNQAVLKIELPALHQKQVLRELQRMNLNRASLFPDLDGYAASMRLRYNSLRTPEEVLADRIRKLEDNEYRFLP